MIVKKLGLLMVNPSFDITIGKSLPILVPKRSDSNIFVQATIKGDNNEL